MEVGSQATPFEHRSFGEELALCQRYCIEYYGSDDIQIGWILYDYNTVELLLIFQLHEELISVTALDSD